MLAPFMSVVLYGNLLVLINVLCYQLVCLENGILNDKKKRKPINLRLLLIGEDECPLPTYP